MPLSKYNDAFGGSKGAALKAYTAMVQEYGHDKGESVFYGKVNKRKGKTASTGRTRRQG